VGVAMPDASGRGGMESIENHWLDLSLPVNGSTFAL
jgi:hypothetical protein